MSQVLGYTLTALSLSLLLTSLLAVFLSKTSNVFFSVVLALAGLALIALAIAAGGDIFIWQAPSIFSIGCFPVTFRLDRLAAIFLGLLGTISVAVALFSPGYLSRESGQICCGRYWSCLLLFVLAMALVVLSGDAVTFIVFWEVMSLASAFLVAAEHKQHQVRKAMLIYLGATRVATALIALGFIWMHALTNSWEFVNWHFDSASCYGAALLLLLGFCIKAGSWPFHIWLPYAHPAAPTPVSALMSGVMVKIALYALIRMLVLGDLNCLPLSYLTLFLGAASAFWGVLFALVQNDLKRLLAYSTVENVGIILMGIGASLIARSANITEIAAIALAAALVHCLNHGLFKSLLFLGAGSVNAATHTRELGQLGGLAKTMPWTTACFLVGVASICAFPPFNGFAGEWLLYQSLFRNVWLSGSLVDRGLSLGLVGILALVGGLAVACFSKVVGVAFLGNARSGPAGRAQEVSPAMTAGQLLLAACCLVTGLTVPQMLYVLKPICDLALHTQSHVEDAFTVPQAGIGLVMFSLIFVIYAVVLRNSRVRKYITWDCGFGQLSARTQVAPESFAQSIAAIFKVVLGVRVTFEMRGRDRRHFPELMKVRLQMKSFLEEVIYLPAISFIGNLAGMLAKLQAGSIHLYLVYLCCTLVGLLLLGTQM